MRQNTLTQNALRVARKSGFLTKPLWTEFFCHGKKRHQNRSWFELKKKYFLDHPSKIAKNVLVPIKLLAGVPAPFVNQIEHDEEVLRIILNLEKSAEILSWKSEMELKQAHTGNLKIKKDTKTIKFPDLEIKTGHPQKATTLALEVELNQKSKKRYKEIALTYAFHNNSDLVIFVCAEEAIERCILDSFNSVRYPFNEKPIGIAKLSEWRKDPLNGLLKINGVCTTLNILLESIKQESGKLVA